MLRILAAVVDQHGTKGSLMIRDFSAYVVEDFELNLYPIPGTDDGVVELRGRDACTETE